MSSFLGQQFGGDGCHKTKSLAVRDSQHYRCVDGPAGKPGHSVLIKGFKKVRLGPKRPLSSYMFFVQKHQGEYNNAKSYADAWKQLSPSQKTVYETLSKDSSAQYANAMKNFTGPTSKIEQKPYVKRSETKYIAFCKANRANALKSIGSGPWGVNKNGKPLTQSNMVIKKLAQMWKLSQQKGQQTGAGDLDWYNSQNPVQVKQGKQAPESVQIRIVRKISKLAGYNWDLFSDNLKSTLLKKMGGMTTEQMKETEKMFDNNANFRGGVIDDFKRDIIKSQN